MKGSYFKSFSIDIHNVNEKETEEVNPVLSPTSETENICPTEEVAMENFSSLGRKGPTTQKINGSEQRHLNSMIKHRKPPSLPDTTKKRSLGTQNCEYIFDIMGPK